MNLVFSLIIALLAFVAVLLLTSTQRFRILLGLMLFSQAVHLFLFSRGELFMAGAPLTSEHGDFVAAQFSDPLIQALILTAIVISFAITAFAAALFLKQGRPRR